jgi:filamentous hemagglutinin
MNKNIRNTIDKSLPLEQQAKQAFELRNKNKAQAREFMEDRVNAQELDRDFPIPTWEEKVKKYSAEGYSGDDLWNAIISGAQRSNKAVNEKFGIQ